MAMQFWEEVKKNAKEAADLTVKKTSEITAIAKATVAIKTEEGKLSSCYKEIGRLFYTAERDGVDYTDEIATFIMQADKIKASIVGYQKEIAAMKKIAICEFCGNEMPTEALFCPTCGAKILNKTENCDNCTNSSNEECCCESVTEENVCHCADDCSSTAESNENVEVESCNVLSQDDSADSSVSCCECDGEKYELPDESSDDKTSVSDDL